MVAFSGSSWKLQLALAVAVAVADAASAAPTHAPQAWGQNCNARATYMGGVCGRELAGRQEATATTATTTSNNPARILSL